uniref:Indole-3-acetate beta-glucosyltransferase 1 n=2 Tax=Cajanus cajan TaxID=3821 RepID=A0A151QNW9_CAJCA|nr:Indole-3-acetate beta-glucosyltransferase 1 [Cajanus cajan]
MYEKQLLALDEETRPRILVNTFEALEPEALSVVEKLNMIPIGPLIPSAFYGKDPSDNSFGGDVFDLTNGYVEWLEKKKEMSVVYVSFGSYCVLSKAQMEEVARALLDCGRPFLWVVREKEELEVELELGLGGKGKIVTWCSQVEVLSHGAVGCFVTHCGWNSAMESLASGVPMVAFPLWVDQKTNAKLIEDVWKVGVRVDGEVNEEGVVQRERIREGLEVVMGSGERGEELRKNANKWKDLARDAVKQGGSSDNNLRAFLRHVQAPP